VKARRKSATLKEKRETLSTEQKNADTQTRSRKGNITAQNAAATTLRTILSTKVTNLSANSDENSETLSLLKTTEHGTKNTVFFALPKTTT
jgi:predicted peptidase